MKEVSLQTVQRVLNKEGIFSRIAVFKPHFDKQLAFAQAHIDWSLEDWKKGILTDKRSFELLKNPTPTRIWRTQGEQYSFDCQVAQHHSGHQSIMVWEGFCDTKQSALIIMGPNAHRTQGFIKNVYSIGLLPVYDHLQQRQQVPQLLSCQYKDSQGIIKFQWPSNPPI
ncbi:hypothetical protein O181_058934 [Austropuccinia psidii MF-1]|uniref:Transposase Tc1-like domain-containing protein n=1 Tax=Austropuccinia psidii MF-1 TaxID=1389203 RepID=A0A9Q3HY53_9BASI|nr:hypothetical protein [Austropuccinia psidii MF-1]